MSCGLFILYLAELMRSGVPSCCNTTLVVDLTAGALIVSDGIERPLRFLRSVARTRCGSVATFWSRAGGPFHVAVV